MRIRMAITTKKMKLDRVSNPNQLANTCNGSGKIAIMIKMIGRRNQAIELRMDKLLLVKPMIIMMNKIAAATAISICRVVISLSSLF